MGVQELLLNHELLETDIGVVGAKVNTASQQAAKFAEDEETGGDNIVAIIRS